MAAQDEDGPPAATQDEDGPPAAAQNEDGTLAAAQDDDEWTEENSRLVSIYLLQTLHF